MRAWWTIACISLFSTVARADGAPPPPAYLAWPAGATVERVEYHRYAALEMGVPDWQHPTTTRGSQRVKGTVWLVTLKGVPAGSSATAFAPLLEAAGWQAARPGGTTVAHYTKDGHDTWFIASLPYGARIVEKHDIAPVDVPAPAATPEEIADGQAPPFLPPLAGMKIGRSAHSEAAGCQVANPVIKETTHVGPPSLELRYDGPHEISGLEIQESYVGALGRAGWDILLTGEANNTVAHYAKQGRDIWLKFAPGDGYFSACIADVGAAAAAARLKRELDAVGHVAMYGIYFDTDKATLRSEADATLHQILDLLTKYKDLALEIQGHTDNTGSHDHNQALSESRAASVKAWLVDHHVDGKRLTTAGYAETKPVAPNTTAEGRQKNRRVELAKNGK